MEQAMKDAMQQLGNRSSMAKDSGDAMRLSQSALNLAHMLAVMANIDIEKKRAMAE